jgi:Domain of unknown function (DUF4136)
MKQFSVVCLAVVLAAVTVAAQKPKYGVTVTADRKADFTGFKSYSWDAASWPAMDKSVHQQIVDAVDRELKALGLEKRASAPADILLSYGSQRRTDVDLKAKGPTGKLPEYPVGTLVVLMRGSASGKEVFRGRVDKPIQLDPNTIGPIIDEVVTEMFAKYPTRTSKR